MKKRNGIILVAVAVAIILCVAIFTLYQKPAFEGKLAITDNGIAFIEELHDFSETAHTRNGIETIGYSGCTVENAEKYGFATDSLSAGKAHDLLLFCLVDAEAKLDSFLKKESVVLNQSQYDALISLTMDLGPDWMQENSPLYHVLTAESYTEKELADAFASLPSPEVRAREAALFLYDLYEPCDTQPQDAPYTPNLPTKTLTKRQFRVMSVVIKALNVGFVTTLELFLVTLVGALPLGLIISFGSKSKFKPLKALTKTIVWIFRGSPLLLQLMIVFYIPGLVLESNPWAFANGRFWAAATAFILNYACYFSEIFRGGIESIPVGQTEAGRVLGMKKSQIFFKVTLLQLIKRILPPISNEIITLVKDTSLANTIALAEVIMAGERFMKSSGLVWPLFFTGIYYLAFTGVLTLFLGWLERKLNYFKV